MEVTRIAFLYLRTHQNFVWLKQINILKTKSINPSQSRQKISNFK